MKYIVLKKLKKCFAVFATLLLMIRLYTSTVNAASSGRLSVDTSNGWWYGGTSWGEAGIMTVSGDIVFCVERNKEYTIGNWYDIVSEDDMSSVGLSRDQVSRISLIVYFAKQRVLATGNSDWYSIAQNAVWKIQNNLRGWILSNTFNTKDRVDQAIAELEAEVDQYYVVPSFDNTTQDIRVGETIRLTDNNGVLNTFVVDDAGGLDVRIEGNDLIITASVSSASLENIRLTKNISAEDTGVSMLYSAGESQQKLGLFKVGDPRFSVVSFAVEKTGQVQFHKVDENNEPVQGLTFEYSYDRNTILGQAVTGSDGLTPVIQDINAGTLYVRETNAPVGIVVDGEWKAITIVAGETAYFNASNDYQKFQLQIVKTENDWDTIQQQYNNTPLEGVRIALYAGEDLYIGSRLVYHTDDLISQETTNENGYIEFDNLPAGLVYYKEVSVPTGYVLDADEHYISLDYGDDQLVDKVVVQESFENQIIYGKAELSKTNGQSQLLEGAVFNVYTEDGQLVVEGLISDSNGHVTTPYLRYGTYYLEEISAPVGYWKSDDKIYFTIDEHQETVYVTTANQAIEALILVNKVDEETLQPLSGAIFKIYDLSANEFVTIKYRDGKEVVEKDTWVTDEDGQFLLEANLPYGEYLLIETEAPEGYNIAEPVMIVIDDSQPYQIIEIIGTVLETTIPNRPIRADISVAKVDSETGERLPNFLMRLTNLSDNSTFELLTNEDGIALFENYKYGQYMVEEIAVDGNYIIDHTKKFVSITEDGITYDVVFENTLAKGQFDGLKVDYKNGEPVSGASYGLFDLDDNLLKTTVTDDKGMFNFYSLELGDYYVQELETVDGYILDDTKYYVTFDYENEDTPVVKVSLQINEVRIPEIGTSASFVHRDKEEPKIITLVDEVAYENLTVGKEYTLEGVLMNQQTGEPVIIDGKPVTGSTTFTPLERDGIVEVFFTFNITKLETQTVVVFEELFEEDIQVAVHTDINDVNQTVEFLTVRFVKIDSITKEKLAGAEFTQFDKDGNVIAIKTSDTSGVVEFTVVEDEYAEFKETKAPAGYQLSDEVIKITGQKEIAGNLYEFEYQNILLPTYTLPKTGIEVHRINHYLGLAMLISGGLIVLLVELYKKREKDKK